MEYNYELLRKCHGLRFRATLSGKPQEGVIKVTSEGVMLCYGEEDPGNLATFGRRNTLSFSKETSVLRHSDFEIVPRDPEKYTDWQVGDEICGCDENKEIIFRSGEVVVFKDSNGQASGIFTCRELFEAGYRLVRTDVEEQIIEEQKKYEPQDGDICFASTDTRRQRFIIIYDNNSYSLANFGSGWELRKGVSWEYSHIRPSTDDERQKLFDALAKQGKRWNAEKKVVEDIEPEDVQKMISDALKGYIPEGAIEGFPVEVIAKMLERQYEQAVVVDVSVFEDDRYAGKALSGFTWRDTEEGFSFWWNVISELDFTKFFEKYPKAEAPGAGMSFSFKRFDPVLVRDRDNEGWHPMVFSRKEGDKFYVLSVLGGFVYYNQCIPLDKDTEKLIGKTEQYYEQ